MPVLLVVGTSPSGATSRYLRSTGLGLACVMVETYRSMIKVVTQTANRGSAGSLKRSPAEARLAAALDRVLAVDGLELGEDVRHVVADRLIAEYQPLRDLLVRLVSEVPE